MGWASRTPFLRLGWLGPEVTAPIVGPWYRRLLPKKATARGAGSVPGLKGASEGQPSQGARLVQELLGAGGQANTAAPPPQPRYPDVGPVGSSPVGGYYNSGPSPDPYAPIGYRGSPVPVEDWYPHQSAQEKA